MTKTERELKLVNSFNNKVFCIREACNRLDLALAEEDECDLLSNCFILALAVSDLSDVILCLSNFKRGFMCEDEK